MPNANPFASIPSVYNKEVPWYMGGGGSGGPLGPGPFPAAPVLGQPSPGQMNTPGLPPMDTPMAVPTTSGPAFNGLMDPSRGGFYSTIGAMLGYPTRAENQKQQMGAARSAGLQKLGDMINSGVPAQKAILDFIKTPEGANFIANSNDPSGEMKQFLGLSTPDNTGAIRSAAFGGEPGADATGAAGAVPGLEPGRTAQQYLDVAQKLSEAGDNEGAKIAISMAEQARLSGTAAEQAVTTEDIKNYKFYSSQEEAAGRQPQSIQDWKNTQIRSGVQNAEGQPIHPKLVEEAIAASNAADLNEQSYEEALQFRDLAKGANTGWLQSMTLPFQQALRSIGITVSDTIPLSEQIQALSNQMALRLRNPESGFGLTGNTSNFDLQFLRGATAGLDKTPEANQAVLILLGSRMRRGALLDRAKADYIWQHGDLRGWGDVAKELKETTPLLTDGEKEMLNALRETNGLAKIVGQDANGAPIFGPEPVVPQTPPAVSERWGAIPDTFLSGTTDATLRQRAWEIYNEDKNNAGGKVVKQPRVKKGDQK